MIRKTRFYWTEVTGTSLVNHTNTMAPKQRGTAKKVGKRTGQRRLNTWSEELMAAAISEYKQLEQEGQMPNLRLLARAWNVPKSTLQRRVKGKVRGHGHSMGRNPVLAKEQEEMLANLIKTLSKRGFPMRKPDVQKLAFQYAAANGIRGFSEGKGKAGHYWFEGFMARNPSLSMRKPEARSACFTSTAVQQWFGNYEELLRDLEIQDVPSHIWNCDETRLQDHFTLSKVDVDLGAPCYHLTASLRGETTTVLASLNAAGQYGPLLIIFKGKRLRAEWLLGSPDNCMVRISENGWINPELFLEWGRQFVAMLPKDDLRPHVLLLDGHSSRVFNLDFLMLMMNSNVHVVCFPSHAARALRPAEWSLFKSLKHNWNLEGQNLTRQTGRKKLQRMDFFAVFTRAWDKAAVAQTAQTGFRRSGVYPVNINATNHFRPSITTEWVMDPSHNTTQHSSHCPPPSAFQHGPPPCTASHNGM
ncbi:uncharacterized protein si:rp71-1d10.8 [Brienomyrus brachyistius]|uniref:uncharacterized protein si:rp71-1d10.8 n=1 Tax=Brienomyrus brachyistius TaxID=42636 RepID=UPI0020B3F663|nr:uncharacterized protein si:rp71-1d10.8 [Brienomyrus brachyistius]